jgi:hypothetical protein
VDDVKLIANDDGTFGWYCESCGIEHISPRSFLGQVRCPSCSRVSFVSEVLR